MTAKHQPKTGGGVGNTIGLIVVALFSAAALWGLFGGSAPESTARPIPASQTVRPVGTAVPRIAPESAPGSVSGSAPARTGEPWEYDAATNQHWNPLAGHQHWHQGQPPPQDQRNATTLTPAPITTTPFEIPSGASRPERDGAPWEYDAESGFHWNPLPGHDHWHQGQPPPDDQRNATTPTSTPLTATPFEIPPSASRPERDGAPWEYDAESGFHWNPLPGHDHWHRGEAPPEDQR